MEPSPSHNLPAIKTTMHPPPITVASPESTSNVSEQLRSTTLSSSSANKATGEPLKTPRMHPEMSLEPSESTVRQPEINYPVILKHKQSDRRAIKDTKNAPEDEPRTFRVYGEQRWDRAGRVGFGGMTRPARRRDLDFLDRPDRRPSGFRPSDRSVRRSEA
jgi:hypothetical protein